ncbi:hypothetical protein COT99_02020 [Candidatus Falkowbacteria bacterium CG10_big_fil_rev_8_21_14_0_10_43_10]|uniref:Uncharacterized protein n=1 Tax=Candidatus Falkowbacteria bacterium CG10_big_fil_rev_8_21_14_0_10_43_10 TaxID=1974567 RepID=A0A2H0V296_9BACT|nr:MAG: hypothetical protein COT99_02020 [Candidatus Falkowbacteria bacterium CG10_big_fil_rev_8_21_14_0_10_43_10]
MLNRFIPIFLSLIFFTGWETIVFNPRYFFAALAIIVAALLFLAVKINKLRVKDRDFWLLLTPCLFLVSLTTVFLLFLNYNWTKHLLIILTAAACYYFLNYLYNLINRITNYRPLSLESASSFFNVVSYLFLGVSVYGLINLLNLSLWILALAVIAVTFILTYQFFWINKIDENSILSASILVSIIMIEFFWALSIFPVSHFISGLSLAIIYYVIINLSLLHFIEKLNRKAVRLYLAVGLICIFIILLSAQWL